MLVGSLILMGVLDLPLLLTTMVAVVIVVVLLGAGGEVLLVGAGHMQQRNDFSGRRRVQRPIEPGRHFRPDPEQQVRRLQRPRLTSPRWRLRRPSPRAW